MSGDQRQNNETGSHLNAATMQPAGQEPSIFLPPQENKQLARPGSMLKYEQYVLKLKRDDQWRDERIPHYEDELSICPEPTKEEIEKRFGVSTKKAAMQKLIEVLKEPRKACYRSKSDETSEAQ